MKPSIVFKGIVKGSYSKFQACDCETAPVMSFEGNSLHEVIQGLVIEEWTFILKVNGRRIRNVANYIKRQGLNLEDYSRYQNGEMVI
jgi:hypothetical protein